MTVLDSNVKPEEKVTDWDKIFCDAVNKGLIEVKYRNTFQQHRGYEKITARFEIDGFDFVFKTGLVPNEKQGFVFYKDVDILINSETKSSLVYCLKKKQEEFLEQVKIDKYKKPEEILEPIKSILTDYLSKKY